MMIIIILLLLSSICGSDDSMIFGSVTKFFLCFHNNSRTTALSLMKFCVNMYVNNLLNCIEFQGYRSQVKVTVTRFLHSLLFQDRALLLGR